MYMNLKAEMARKGITNEQLANGIGINPATMSAKLNIAGRMKIQALYLTGTALLIGAAGVGDSITFDAVGSWTGAAILTVLMAAGGIVCWGYGRGLEIEQAEKAQLRRYCRKLKRCQSGAEEKNDRHSA